MNDAIKNIIEKIKRLNALAANNPNPNEAANAAAAAAKLIADYQIAEADLIVKGEAVGEEIIIDHTSKYTSGRRMVWIENLMAVLTEHFGCSMYWTKKHVAYNNRGSSSVATPVVIGRKSDVEVVHYFFDWLHPLLSSMAKSQASGRGFTYSQTFLIGAVRGIELQFDRQRAEAKRAAQQENRVQAMVLLDNRKNLSKEFMNDSLKARGVKLTHGPASRMSFDGDAHAAGQRAGQNINLSRGLAGAKGPNRLT